MRPCFTGNPACAMFCVFLFFGGGRSLKKTSHVTWGHMSYKKKRKRRALPNKLTSPGRRSLKETRLETDLQKATVDLIG